LGNGTTNNSSTPLQVPNLSQVVALAAGYGHSLALRSDGTVWAWGDNSYGQLGNGTTTNSSTPVQVSGLSGIVAISAGGYHSLALRSDGTVWAWGENSFGQLGNGTATDSYTPVHVSSSSGIVAISAGGSHSLAVRSDGTVWAWGNNFAGELGNGTFTDSSTPVQVSGLSGVTAIAGGGYHSLALTTVPVVPPLDHFTIIPSTMTPMAGVPFSVTVTALDAASNLVPGYTGTVHFTLSNTDTGATLPANYTFVSDDSGSHIFTNGVILTALGSQTINVNDTVQTTATGSANVNVAAAPQADLALNATAAPVFGACNVSGVDVRCVTYSVTVTNTVAGSATATNVVVTDTLNRYGYLSASGPGGPSQCSENAGVVSCDIGSLPYPGQATLTVTVTPPSYGWASNVFHARADQPDPNPANNSVQIGPVVEGANTAVGANVAAFAAETTTGASVAVTFSNVSQSGNTTMTASASGPAPPAGYRAGAPAVFYDLHTTATWSGSAVVNLSYPGLTFHKPAKVRLFHQENGVWVDRTAAIDTTRNLITALVPSFSLFALFEPVNHAPVAAAGTVVAPGVSAAGAPLKLDASASTDADGDALTYRWTGSFPEGGGAITGATPTVSLPLGVSNLMLVVNDGETDSAPLAVAATVSDFSLDLPAASLSATRGQPVSLTVTLTPKYGAFNGAIALACPNLPAGSTCAFSSPAVTPGSQTATATLTLTIGAATASAAPAQRGGSRPRLPRGQTLYALWLGMLPFGLLLAGGVRRKRACWLLLALVLSLVAGQFACGGGGGSSAPATTTQTSTVMVTVSGTSGSLTHSSTATLMLH